MFEKILVALDDAESSRTIFAQALMLAKVTRSTLMLIHVLTILDDFYPGDAFVSIPTSVVQTYANLLEQRKKAGIEKLKLLAVEATAAGIPIEFTQNVGDPGKLICEVAKTWNANLIVIGRRGLSGLSELFMGSTSNYVLHHSQCNVLTIQGTTQTLTQLKTEQTLASAT